MKNWCTEKLCCEEYSINDLVRTLEVLEQILRKYPQDDTIKCMIDIVRDEACMMFGGELPEENYMK